ncbi:hypothetical protein N0V90_003697 [Kalmusia sp. IMI 367209]|nr:hypothetical protein N0V90_003697 [Kalmusia sp. IMI 367209]
MLNPIRRIQQLRQKPTLTSANRTTFTHEQWKGNRTKFILQTTAGGIAFMLWFLACCSYLFGTLYKSPVRHDKLHFLAVDYDGGVVGQAMTAAYHQLEGPTFFTLEYHSAEEYPTQEDIYHAVWEGRYWASIAVSAGASQRLSAALEGGEAAASYNPANALHYVWNQQRYSAFSNSAILSSMQQLIGATRIAYNKMNGTQAAQFLNGTDPAAVQAFMNPIAATERNIKPAPFGSVILLNTVAMAMPVLQQFFFLLVLNGVVGKHNLYTKMTVYSSLLVRRVAGILYTCGAALCQAGYFWAFDENWNVNGNQFVLTWMTLWLLMHVHFLVLDSISTVAPLPVMPFVVLAYIFINIASSLSPLELQAGFYHWGIALPSYNAYSIFVTIWTGGSTNRLYRALPILFAWWIVGNLAASATHVRACHLAYKFQQEDGAAATTPAKDEEAPEEPNDSTNEAPISRMTTSRTAVSALERQRTVEERATEHRIVYGPSMPPFA